MRDLVEGHFGQLKSTLQFQNIDPTALLNCNDIAIRTTFFTRTIPLGEEGGKKKGGHAVSHTKVIESLPLSHIRLLPLINALKLAVLWAHLSCQSCSQDALKE